MRLREWQRCVSRNEWQEDERKRAFVQLRYNEPSERLPSCRRENGDRLNTFCDITWHAFTCVQAKIGETLAEREKRLEGIAREPEIHYHISLNKYSEDFLVGKIDREVPAVYSTSIFRRTETVDISILSPSTVYLSSLSLALLSILSLPFPSSLPNIHVLSVVWEIMVANIADIIHNPAAVECPHLTFAIVSSRSKATVSINATSNSIDPRN